MSFTTTIKKNKITIAGSGTMLSILLVLYTLAGYGITVSTSGNIQCLGDAQDPCISYINISTTNSTLTFPKAVLFFDNESNVNYTLYRADLRYAPDNPKRWVIFNISGKTLPANALWQLKLIGYKKPTQAAVITVGSGSASETIVWSVSPAEFPYESCFNSTVKVCDLYPLDLSVVPKNLLHSCYLVRGCS